MKTNNDNNPELDYEQMFTDEGYFAPDSLENYGNWPKPGRTKLSTKILDWTIIILAIILLVWCVTGCKKADNPNVTTTDNVRVVLSVKYTLSDSIEFYTGGKAGISYIKANTKEYDYTLTNSYPSGSGSTYYKYCNNTAIEYNATGQQADSIRMQVYVNGAVVFNQVGFGIIKYQIQY
jgi:hypothetical protein